MSMAEENPFAALLKDPNAKGDGVSKQLIEDVFLFTLRRNSSPSGRALLCLADVIVQDLSEDETMSEELLAHAIFERLMLTDMQQYLLSGSHADDALEDGAVIYLYRAFVACEQAREKSTEHADDCHKIKQLILTNVSTCMRQPDLFQGRTTISMQWLHLLGQYDDVVASLQDFLVQIVQKVMSEDEQLEGLGALKAIFYPMLGEHQKQIAHINLISLKVRVFSILSYFVWDKRAPALGEILIDYTTPNPNAKGAEYMNTLFGELLRLSIMPKTTNGPYEFFADVSMESQQIDPPLWKLMSTNHQAIFIIVKQLLVLSNTTKKKTLQWIANCLQANVTRGHLMSNMNLTADQPINQHASDAFMIGLTAVLLRLCAPLCEPTLKIFLVDPTYCAVPDSERQAKQVSLHKADESTCLLPTEEQKQRHTAEKYNFVTELFYMTHKAFELSYFACYMRFTRMARELQNLQTAYEDMINRNPNNELAKNLLRMFKEQMQQYLCLRNTMMEPEGDSYILKFFEASAIWLTEITLSSQEEFEACVAQKDFAPHQRRNRELPDKVTYVPAYLQSVPENILDNVVAYFNFSRHCPPGQFIEVYQSAHDAFFRMFILFMGSSELVRNPHLRAQLAEALEFFLPRPIAGSKRDSFVSHVFDNHADRLKLVPSLLNVFVSIEMTGQSVQFEQKFNYRRPMYAIMEYLWTKEEQVASFKECAVQAELNMEAIEPPIFLRFINLLINDSIFLLDESLSNLQQIRQLQQAQANGEWEAQPHNERQQHLGNLHYLSMMARYDNILGRDTINILKLLTTEIKSIFCHNSMVERMAAMLNYFLLNLVGPQRKKFKVKDKKEFEFDPAQTVKEICCIYINLSSSDKFCLAVSQDGRSYSSQLFRYTEEILVRIGGWQLIGEIEEFALKVQKMETQYKKEQEFLADAPEEYLDPIMSTLMTDPVILPSSNVTVDRTTIARHLLSDQTDPFNRAPLTMDKVKTNATLKTEIENWIAEKRALGCASQSDECAS